MYFHIECAEGGVCVCACVRVCVRVCVLKPTNHNWFKNA